MDEKPFVKIRVIRGRFSFPTHDPRMKKGRPLRDDPFRILANTELIFWLVHNRHRVFDRFDDLADMERLAKEPIERT